MCVRVCVCVCVCVCVEKKLSRDKLRKQDTSLNFDRTTEALKRFESVTAPIDEDDDDDGGCVSGWGLYIYIISLCR